MAEVKLLVVGQGRVGKTHLRRRLFDTNNIAYYAPIEEPTRHIDCTEKWVKLPPDHRTKLPEVKLRIWDFGGQNELHSTHLFFLGFQRCFYVLVLAADRAANGEGESNRLNYWLRLVAQHGQSSDGGKKAPILVVVTRNDTPEAADYREQLDEALCVAEASQWFGANVVEVIRGVGWSDRLNKYLNPTTWENHLHAANAVNAAIEDSLHLVPDLTTPISTIYHQAKKYVEKVFQSRGFDDEDAKAWMKTDDEGFAKLFETSRGYNTRKEREELRDNCFRFLDNLGVAHWIGDTPEIVRANWKVGEIVFNPEWVRPPFYELVQARHTDPPGAWFVSDERVRELLPERRADWRRASLYERIAFQVQDREWVLALLKARRLIFDNLAPGGIVVPDRLQAAALLDDAPVGSWKYEVDFLPERVFLRFVAEQYGDIASDTGLCFRNCAIWRPKFSSAVQLQSHSSPPGAVRPFVLIRSLESHQSVDRDVAMRIQILLNEIYKKERLADVNAKLIPPNGLVSAATPNVSTSQNAGGIGRSLKSARLVRQLRTFWALGSLLRDQKENEFSARDLAQYLEIAPNTLGLHLRSVVQFFCEYFWDFGHPPRGKFKVAGRQDHGADEEYRIFATKSSSGWRLCEPVGWWAWKLTSEYLEAIGETPKKPSIF